MQESVDKSMTESERQGLSLTVMKTFYMFVWKRKEASNCHVMGNREVINQVEQFSQFGIILTSDGSCDKEIK